VVDAGIRERLTHWLSKVFALNTSAVNWGRGALLLDVVLVPLMVFWSIGYEQYLISAVFGAVFALVCDPGGAYGQRLVRMVLFALTGAGLTALGFGLGGSAWGWLVLVTFAVTLGCGLAVVRGVHVFVAGMLLNIWFIIALGYEFSLHQQTRITSYVWAQTLAWAAGSALWIAVASVAWLLGGRGDATQPVAEIPGDATPRTLSPQIVGFAVIRAVALAGAVALAFGADLSHAVWLPIATVIAMRPSLEQGTLIAAQRVVGALIGAVAAGLLLLIPAHEHGARLLTVDQGLEIVAIVLLMHAAAIRFVNYTHYTAAVAAAVLILVDLTQPSNYSAEGYRVLWTLIGVTIGVVVMLLAQLLAKRRAPA
jgi:hypothetical protein